MKLTEEKLGKKVEAAYRLLEECCLCPRRCGVNRLKNEKGYCQAGKELIVSSWGPHFGEEDVLVGIYGSGTIFFTGCNLSCCFCQNFDISHLRRGTKMEIKEFIQVLHTLVQKGCHNINLVTPAHFVPQILQAVAIAKSRGFSLPLVYNCGGYESVETLKLLEGVIDIYMPDAKYGDDTVAQELSNAQNYFTVVKEAMKEMHRQVGDLQLDSRGIAIRGLLVRHLVLPGGLAGTENLMHFIATEISKNTYVNIMDQYYPCYNALSDRRLSRPITREEFHRALKVAETEGIHRGIRRI
jgi:putative pyruvate formate lyase activating enzyme